MQRHSCYEGQETDKSDSKESFHKSGIDCLLAGKGAFRTGLTDR